MRLEGRIVQDELTLVQEHLLEDLSLKLEPVMKAIGESNVRKIIFVPNRILNVVL